ncbi:VTT domain-containing protein [Nitrosomonas halophila]|uniref:Phosphatidylserine/phosphatidylglycerophosphate/cardiolipin synthase n=1 Tax=Nitrosomonas halophila TaxID=44576 RepID=A0A1H3PS05_9PROT|nr:VTT domain-containing protein [Nitrosomonas halophila]SDZ03761.1 Phosphatidylserine/phosphatidylglycerophosphate/cardiolipin synthase [Nitrosomonas halophila]
MKHNRIIHSGHNCWRVADATKVSILVDGEDYFRALHEVMQRARHAIYILAWDMDSRVRLLREEQPTQLPTELGELINTLLKQRPGLEVYILNWDWAMLYALEREWIPIYWSGWKKQSRLHYELDAHCPFGGSQHQKLVIIDDKIAFCGGIDLGKHRWDSSAHAPKDSRRIDPNNKAYPPFHDMQMLVEGEAAKALAELARARWLQATGEQLSAAPISDANNLWPEHVEALFSQVKVAIARTVPAFNNTPEKREVESLYIDSISAAKRLIYIENQYFTAGKIAKILASRLTEPDGPEVVLVQPLRTGGWLEQHTMDVLRYRVTQKLRDADQHNRLRICYPRHQALGEAYIGLHSKLMIVDDDFLRIGSANLSNRSMGLDSECDLAIEADNTAQQEAIRAFRSRLLSEHFDLSEGELKSELARQGSLLKLIDTRQNFPRTLSILDCKVEELTEEILPDSDYIDPERPTEMDALAEEFIPVEESKSIRKQLITTVMVLSTAVFTAGLWKWSVLGDWIALQREVIDVSQPLSLFVTTLGFALAGLLAVPVTLLVILVAVFFDFWPGIFYTISGALLSTLMGYAAGYFLGRKTVTQLAGHRLNRLSRQLIKNGLMAVIRVRLVPVAPFAIINLVAGATHLYLKNLILGTLLGMLPGILIIFLFVELLVSAIDNPEPDAIISFVIFVGSIALVLFMLKKRLDKDFSDNSR